MLAAERVFLLILISHFGFPVCEAFLIRPMSVSKTSFGTTSALSGAVLRTGNQRNVFQGQDGSVLNHKAKTRFMLNACLSGLQKGIEESTEKATFDPILVRVGRQPVLRIVPDDCKDRNGNSFPLQDLVIKPGFAWGDGAHPSTYMCLQFICAILGAQKYNNASVLDYGTGSGVLAIAAKRCGAGRVVGIDKDDEILSCAQENLDLNFGSGKGGIELVHGRDLATSCKGVMLGESSKSTQFDLVVANMLPAALIRMAPTIVNAVRDQHGVLALCGMRRDQVADVTAVYERNGVKLEEESSMVGSAPGLDVAFHQMHISSPQVPHPSFTFENVLSQKGWVCRAPAR